VVFVDDNIAGNKAYAKQLFKALTPLKINWGSQASLTMARDPELLELAAKSGCTALFIGVESISEENYSRQIRSLTRLKSSGKSLKDFMTMGS